MKIPVLIMVFSIILDKLTLQLNVQWENRIDLHIFYELLEVSDSTHNVLLFRNNVCALHFQISILHQLNTLSAWWWRWMWTAWWCIIIPSSIKCHEGLWFWRWWSTWFLCDICVHSAHMYLIFCYRSCRAFQFFCCMMTKRKIEYDVYSRRK